LIYTEGGTIWQCQAGFDRLAFDGIQTPLHPSHDLVVATREFEPGGFQSDVWEELVRTYTLRKLTFPNDRLEALAGIVAMAAALWNTKYYAGMWAHDMESKLGWRVDRNTLHEWGWHGLQAPAGRGHPLTGLCVMLYGRIHLRQLEMPGSFHVKLNLHPPATLLERFFLASSLSEVS
jgi:hypothetical protein